MAERIPMSELESYLWGSAVLLRTNIDAGSYGFGNVTLVADSYFKMPYTPSPLTLKIISL